VSFDARSIVPFARHVGPARSRQGHDTPGRIVSPSDVDVLRVALGRTVRQLRTIAGASQECLGFAAQLHRNYVGAIERGEINPTLRVLCKVAYGLRVPPSDLLVLAERHAVERPPTRTEGGARSSRAPFGTRRWYPA
jgi:transcriptional regulator with XRE-family HTH domain